MPALNLDLDYFEHPKTKRLIGLLGRGSEVLPIKLWRYCGKYHTADGRLVGHSKQEIESIAGWWGSPGRFYDAMLKVGFAELDGDVFVIHDWKEHAGHFETYKLRATEAAKARWKDKPPKPPDASSNASSNAKQMLKQSSGSAGQGSENLHTAPAREAALSAFDRWSNVARGHGIRHENNEHQAVFDLVESLDQGPPVVRNAGREVVPAGLMVAQAVEVCIEDSKPFKGIKYAVAIVRDLVKNWTVHGMPGSHGAGKNGVGLAEKQQRLMRAMSEDES